MARPRAAIRNNSTCNINRLSNYLHSWEHKSIACNYCLWTVNNLSLYLYGFQNHLYYALILLMNYFKIYHFHFRARKLRTASNRLLLSLLIADLILLVNCYTTVHQTLKGSPVLGAYGKIV